MAGTAAPETGSSHFHAPARTGLIYYHPWLENDRLAQETRAGHGEEIRRSGSVFSWEPQMEKGRAVWAAAQGS